MSLTPLLVMRGITKRFPGALALDSVDLDLEAGEVHVVAGENGAGKSTLMKILAGAHPPDAGEIRLDGHRVAFRGPRDALSAGIAVVYQEGSLAPHLSVAENIVLGREHELGRPLFGRAGPPTWLATDRMRAQARAALEPLGATHIDPDAPVGSLGVAARQIVEVARALARRGRIVVLDEPTASLSEREVPALLEAVRRLRALGTGILYVSHRLEEFAQIGDRVTVLRTGRRVWTGAAREATIHLLVEQMAGRSAEDLFPARAQTPTGTAVLQVSSLSAGPLEDVDLSVGSGEIVGIAGLVGSGRSSLCRALYGALPIRSGTIRLGGAQVHFASPADAVAAGVGLVPEDRQLEGLALALSVGDNITLASLDRFRTGVGLDVRALATAAGQLTHSLGIKCRDIEQPICELSGGNQQKAIVARWMCRDVRLLLCDEPTRGVDVGARADLFGWLARFAASGRGIIVVSSALPELIGLCHRIVVLHRGRVAAELGPFDADERRLVHLMSVGQAA